MKDKSRIEVLRDHLETGACTVTSLAKAMGCDRALVPKYVARLRERGYGIWNIAPPYEGLYMMVRRPGDPPAKGTCISCGTDLSPDHADDSLCSPCHRRAVTEELNMAQAEELPGVGT